MVNIEINGNKIEAREGTMVIEAADEAGVYIPRFCYHKKLSIAANCRMCLVEVEKVGKPLPACATPVTEGMKIFTKSPKAINAQKGVMEFLLINHPLDCPICDQGGECELQDLAMGYGDDLSVYHEAKRVVLEKNIGPLIATDLTRCIHCTRCVRFGEEISGIRELGATGRGQHMEIGTYISKSISSELSGNIIDLCPVGALTSKPFRFSARAWEMSQHDSIAPHDCIGSNIHVHVRDHQVKRVVPKENEAINETWISDRDRFSYEALYSEDRLTTPMIKVNGAWQKTDWETALDVTVKGLRNVMGQRGSMQVGAITSPTATLEELYLFQKLMRDLEINNIDHRVRQSDFSADTIAPVFPWLGQSVESLETVDAVLLVGSDIRREQPIACHRLRKAAVRGAKIMSLNAVAHDFYMPMEATCLVRPMEYVQELAAIAKAVFDLSKHSAADAVVKLVKDAKPNPQHQQIARVLVESKNGSLLLGPQAINHEHAALLAMLCMAIARASQCRFGYLTEAGNTSGAWLSGVLPHRLCGGRAVNAPGLNALQMFSQGLSAYLLLDVEPELDGVTPSAANSALIRADFVLSLSVFKSKQAEQYANVMLPITPFTETSGTYVNAEGRWQSFSAAARPWGDAKPAWKIFRVIGNFFDLVGYDYVSSEQIRDELKNQLGDIEPSNFVEWQVPTTLPKVPTNGVVRVSELLMYAADPIQRRAKSLQQTKDAGVAAFFINSKLAAKTGLKNGDQALASQEGKQLILPVVIDNKVADGCVLIHSGIHQTAGLDNNLTELSLSKI